LKEEGVGSIAYSPLAKGLLTNRYLNGIPADSRAASSSRFLNPQDITEEKIATVRRLNELASTRDQSLAQMAIAWLLREEQLTSVLIGASKVSQIEDCVGALENLDFTPAELQQIEAILQ
jgi:L-glyceraldehyde 3-phosphate reductase